VPTVRPFLQKGLSSLTRKQSTRAPPGAPPNLRQKSHAFPLEDTLDGQHPDAAQVEREADRLDVDGHTLVVAHPDEHGGHGADQRDGAGAEHAIAVVGLLVAELARQQLADGVGIPGGERIEGVGFLDAACRQQVEGQQIVFPPERPSTSIP